MRINDANLNGLNGAGGASTTTGAGRAGQVERTDSNSTGRVDQKTADGDRIQLSGLSQALRVETEDTPERLSKVDQLREAVQGGTYRPDAAEVGKKIIDDALQFRQGGV
jgi:flagellar biosynthesis anti-sigma factor FlgM